MKKRVVLVLLCILGFGCDDKKIAELENRVNDLEKKLNSSSVNTPFNYIRQGDPDSIWVYLRDRETGNYIKQVDPNEIQISFIFSNGETITKICDRPITKICDGIFQTVIKSNETEILGNLSVMFSSKNIIPYYTCFEIIERAGL